MECARLLAVDGRRLVFHDPWRLACGRPGAAGLSHQLLRSGRVRALGRQALAERSGVGSGGKDRTSGRRLWHSVAVDAQRLFASPELRGRAERARRIQRQIHGQSDGVARFVIGDPGGSLSGVLSQFLSPRFALAIQRLAAGRVRSLSLQMNPGQTALRVAPLAASDPFAADVILGLTKKPKRLPPKYFYDATGSALFERITRLPEYYPTRSELELLHKHAPEIV